MGRWGPLRDAASRGSLLRDPGWSHRNRGNTPVPGTRPQEGAQGCAGGGLLVGLGQGSSISLVSGESLLISLVSGVSLFFFVAKDFPGLKINFFLAHQTLVKGQRVWGSTLLGAIRPLWMRRERAAAPACDAATTRCLSDPRGHGHVPDPQGHSSASSSWEEASGAVGTRRGWPWLGQDGERTALSPGSRAAGWPPKRPRPAGHRSPGTARGVTRDPAGRGASRWFLSMGPCLC